MARTNIVILLGLIGTLYAPSAQAEATRIAVQGFAGPSAGRMRAEVVRALQRRDHVTVVPQHKIMLAARKLRADPKTPEGRIAIAKQQTLSAWLDGTLEQRADTLTLVLSVRDGAEDALVGNILLRGDGAKGLSRAIRDELWQETESEIRLASPPGEPDTLAELASSNAVGRDALVTSSMVVEEVAPEAPEPPPTARVEGADLSDGGARPFVDETPPEPEPVSLPKGHTLRAAVGVGSPYRSLAFSDAITPTLGNHELTSMPMADIDVSAFPFRALTDEWISWIGVDAGAQFSVSGTSTDADGNRFDSSYSSYRLGFRGRMPVRQHFVSLLFGYAMNRMSLSTQEEGIDMPTPSVDYRMLRPGVGAEFALSDSVVLGVDAAWHFFLSVGEIARWFPRSTAGGFDVSAFVSHRLTDVLFARFSASYQHAFFDFNPLPGDQNVAGGATDQYLTASVGVGVNI